MNGTSLPYRAAQVPLPERLRAFVQRMREWRLDDVTSDSIMLVARDGLSASNVPFKLFLDAAEALEQMQQPNSAPSDLRERILDEIEDPDDCAHGHPSCAKCLYERREGLLREAADALDRTSQAQRLTDAAYSRLLLLIGNASYTSTVPTKAELEAAINGGAA